VCGDLESVLKHLEQLERRILEHLFNIPSILAAIHNKKKSGCECFDVSPFLYVHLQSHMDCKEDDNNADEKGKEKHENEGKESLQQTLQPSKLMLLYGDEALCEFPCFLRHYRYLCSVVRYYKQVRCHGQVKKKLDFLLQYVESALEGSIWNRKLWQERETEQRLAQDHEITKQLLFFQSIQKKSCLFSYF
ncbi:hypothetical protein RFI_12289, partial [Reticulomyxa filosa]